MTPQQIIRGAIPQADEAICEHILWGRTPFPFAKVTAREIYKAADRFRRAGAHGIHLCEFCDRPAVDGWNCEKCKALGATV